MRRTIDAAEATYRCYLSSKDAFPDPEQASKWAKTVWPVACTRTGTRLSQPNDLADRVCYNLVFLHGFGSLPNTLFLSFQPLDYASSPM